VFIQWQGYSRNQGFTRESFEQVDLSGLRGNEMFSTTLAGMAVFPDESRFVQEPFVGGGVLMAAPNTLYRFVVGPIPRALWHGKPVDPLWARYNSMVTGRSEQSFEGTTIAPGAVGDPYFRYGAFGLMLLATTAGWILRNVEIGIVYAQARPLAMLALLGVAAWQFREFRGLNFQNIYPVIYSCIVMTAICFVLGGRPNAQTMPDQAR
jgi:hypothetical protein